MPDTATTMWLSALEALASSGELGQGKVSIIRMTRVIDVDGTLVLVVGSGFAKDIVEQSRGPISRALASVAGTDVPFEVIVDTSLENSAPVFPRAPIVPIPPAAPTPRSMRSTSEKRLWSVWPPWSRERSWPT